MKINSATVASLLVLTQAAWMAPTAQAQAAEPGRHEKMQKQHHPQRHHRSDDMRDQGARMPMHDSMQNRNYNGPVPLGGYFKEEQREAARDYYGRPENRGFCPPGLAKKDNGCLPPGQDKKWRRGEPLPQGMVFYEIPRSVALTLGPPPWGYRYVRVASDILLIASGTNIVVDALEDMVR